MQRGWIDEAPCSRSPKALSCITFDMAAPRRLGPKDMNPQDFK